MKADFIKFYYTYEESVYEALREFYINIIRKYNSKK